MSSYKTDTKYYVRWINKVKTNKFSYNAIPLQGGVLEFNQIKSSYKIHTSKTNKCMMKDVNPNTGQN